MRDLLVTLLIFGSIPYIFVRPQIGILMWAWIAFMVPHKLSWGYAQSLPVALAIGLATIAALILSKEQKKIPWGGISVLMLLFTFWTNLTGIFAANPAEWQVQALQFNKIIFMTFIALVLMQTEKWLDGLIWVMVCSVAFFGLKGGLFSIRGGIENLVWGPPGGFYEDNNALALALLVILPLLNYLRFIAPTRLVRWALLAAVPICLVSVLGSYSRGAFLAMFALGVVWWWRSNRKIMFAAIMGAALIAVIPFIPSEWYDRMDTINEYQADSSAMGRIEMWEFAIDVAIDRPLIGGGWGAFTDRGLNARYRDGGKPRSAHSIYFQILGTQGFAGLLIFLLLGAAGFRTNVVVRNLTRRRPDFLKHFVLADMCYLSLISFGVAGAFQNAADWDLPYMILAISLLNRVVVERKLAEEKSVQAETVGSMESRKLATRPSFKKLPAHGRSGQTT